MCFIKRYSVFRFSAGTMTFHVWCWIFLIIDRQISCIRPIEVISSHIERTVLYGSHQRLNSFHISVLLLLSPLIRFLLLAMSGLIHHRRWDEREIFWLHRPQSQYRGVGGYKMIVKIMQPHNWGTTLVVCTPTQHSMVVFHIRISQSLYSKKYVQYSIHIRISNFDFGRNPVPPLLREEFQQKTPGTQRVSGLTLHFILYPSNLTAHISQHVCSIPCTVKHAWYGIDWLQ